MGRLNLEAVARRLGVCKGRVLRELVARQLLPWPEGVPATWAEEDVAALERRWAGARQKKTNDKP